MNGRPCNTVDVILPLGDGAKLDDNNLKLQKIIPDKSCLYHALLHLYLNPTIGNAPANPVFTIETSARDIRDAISQYFVQNPWLVHSGWFDQMSSILEASVGNFQNELLDETVYGDARMVQLFSLMTTTVIHTYQLEEDSNTISQAVGSYYPCPSNNPAEAYTLEQLDRFPVLLLAYKSTGAGSDTMASNNSLANHYDAIVKVVDHHDGTIMYPYQLLMDDAEKFIEDGNVLEDDLKDGDEDMDVSEDEDEDENKDGKKGAGRSDIVDGELKADKEKYEWTKIQIKYYPFLYLPGTNPAILKPSPDQQDFVNKFEDSIKNLIDQYKETQSKELIKEIIQKLRNFEVDFVFSNFFKTVYSNDPYSIDVEVRKVIKKVFIVDMMDAPDIDKSRVEIEHFYLRLAHIFRDYRPNITPDAGGSTEKDTKNLVNSRTSRYLNLYVKDPYCHVQIYVASGNVVQFRIDTPMVEYNADDEADMTRARYETCEKVGKILKHFETLLKRSSFSVRDDRYNGWESDFNTQCSQYVMYAKFDLNDINKALFPHEKKEDHDSKRPENFNVFKHSRMLGLRDWFDTVIDGLKTQYDGVPFYPGYSESVVKLLQDRITQCCKEREENKKNPMEGKWLKRIPNRTGTLTSYEDRLKDKDKGLNLLDLDNPNCNMRTGRFTYKDVQTKFARRSSNASCQIYASGKVDIQDYVDDELEIIIRTVIFWMCFAKNDALRQGFTNYMSSVINVITSNCGWHGQFEKYLQEMQDNFVDMRDDTTSLWFFNTHQPRRSKKKQKKTDRSKKK